MNNSLISKEIEKYVRVNQKLNIDNPSTIQDKIAWLKVYDNTYLKSFCADKLSIHTYSLQKIGKDICVPLLEIYNSVNDIDLNALPNSFVLKCNHGCHYNIIVKDKSTFDLNKAKKQLSEWLQDDYSEHGYEMQYKNIPHICFAEKYLENDNGKIIDYKFWCFNGIPKIVTISSDDVINYFSVDKKILDISNSYFPRNPNILNVFPDTFDIMLDYSKKLSKDFKFVRVDLYSINDNIYLGELTFTPGNGRMQYTNSSWNKKLGDMLKL